MARATFVKKAQKDYPEHGIKRGESYWWWKFRYGSKRFSKTQPKASQLTQSEYYSQMYDIEERVSGADADESLRDLVEEVASELRDIASECEDKRSNMPEALQDSETGELLQQRADSCNEAADAFEAIDFSDAPEEDQNEDGDEERGRRQADADEEYWQGKLEEVQGVDINVE